MYSTLCKIWGKIGLPLKTIFELPYKDSMDEVEKDNNS
jgi:hypothetical protein